MTDRITDTLAALRCAASIIEAHAILSEFANAEQDRIMAALIGSIEAAEIWGIGRRQAWNILATLPAARRVGRDWVVPRWVVEGYQRSKPGRKRK